ncbi:glycosyltransferase [Ochrovirga pacifica]|uniref:glycosyltransferase n=1 Tax=Ochrovirga pacifica TaxID=1042376 RepID=UPI00025591A7|nr:glycosyltransferase [Ochrovirga pacifica]
MPTTTQNICILTYSLGGGGAEKVAALQSKMLSDAGHRVFVVSIVDDLQYSYAGKLLNLGAYKKQHPVIGKLKSLWLLKKFLKKNQIQVLIDHRSRNLLFKELVYHFYIFSSYSCVFVVHSHHLLKSFPKGVYWAQFLYKKSNLVTVSKAIEQKVTSSYQLKRIQTIYNCVSIPHQPVSVKTANYILYFGRFDEHAKDLRFLVYAYQKSQLYNKGISLYLMGDGNDKAMIVKLVQDLGLKDSVLFLDYNPNPFPIIQQAKFTVLTSNYEGFPMSIIESLACKTPVVSVDCESGPREIIVHQYNGLLVSKKLDIFARALTEMIVNKELWLYCKQNCLPSIAHLSYHKIKDEWNEYLAKID